MKIYVIHTFNALVPSDATSEEALKTLNKNEVYEVSIKQARNYELLKKFMALVKVGHDNTKLEGMPFDVYRKLMLIRAGYYKMYVTDKGQYIEADSISFSSMSERKFQEVYEKVKQVVATDIGVTNEELELEVLTDF